MGTILLDQYILCNSFANAKSISKAFEEFTIKETFLGGLQKIKASRFIKKMSNISYSHHVIIRYKISFKGSFCSYGYLDDKTIKRHPELPMLLENSKTEERSELISQYLMKDDYMYDIWFYKNFEDFFNTKLSSLMNRIDMACKVAFSLKYRTDFFEVFYEECGQNYKRGHIANSIENRIGLYGDSKNPNVAFSPLPLQSIWDWSQEHYYNKKDKWYSEARSWVSLSYALNRDGYEALLYSIMGIEAIYTNGNKKIKEQLRNTIPKVLCYITEDEINRIYKFRSEFVHGDISIPMYGEKKDINYYASFAVVNIAATILLESIHLLVKNRATKINLDNGYVVFLREQTIRESLKND